MSYILDEQAICDFKKGNEKAFKLVFMKYHPLIVVFINKYTGDLDDAKDILAEVFLSLHKRCHLFNDEPNIRAFLYVSARNRCLNYLKSKKRHGVCHKEIAARLSNDTLLEYDYSIRVEVLELLYKGIEELPEECRKIFKMIFYEEFKPEEVAVLLHISVNTVYVQKHRAIQMLRLKIAEKHL